MKQYKLLIETAEFPKGTIVKICPGLAIYNMLDSAGESTTRNFRLWQIENRPTVWEEVTETIQKEPVIGNKFLPFVPTHDEYYWYISGDLTISETVYQTSCMGDENRRDSGACFRTLQAGKYELLRRQAFAKRWKPKNGERYYYYMINNDSCTLTNNFVWQDDSADRGIYLNHVLFPTKQEALDWGEKYAEAFKILLN